MSSGMGRVQHWARMDSFLGEEHVGVLGYVVYNIKRYKVYITHYELGIKQKCAKCLYLIKQKLHSG